MKTVVITGSARGLGLEMAKCFRTKNFNKTIEEQLALLNGFWQLPENQDCIWNGNPVLQTRYYDYMKRMGFVETVVSKL